MKQVDMEFQVWYIFSFFCLLILVFYRNASSGSQMGGFHNEVPVTRFPWHFWNVLYYFCTSNPLFTMRDNFHECNCRCQSVPSFITACSNTILRDTKRNKYNKHLILFIYFKMQKKLESRQTNCYCY